MPVMDMFRRLPLIAGISSVIVGIVLMIVSLVLGTEAVTFPIGAIAPGGDGVAEVDNVVLKKGETTVRMVADYAFEHSALMTVDLSLVSTSGKKIRFQEPVSLSDDGAGSGTGAWIQVGSFVSDDPGPFKVTARFHTAPELSVSRGTLTLRTGTFNQLDVAGSLIGIGVGGVMLWFQLRSRRQA